MNEKQIQLSKEQLDKIYKYVDYINYIDLKYEIVDHLASSIEAKMEADTKKSFKTALYEETAQVPLTGFHEFIVSKEKALTKYWIRKILWSIKGFFTLPRAVLFFFVILILIKIKFVIHPIPFQWIGIGISILFPITEIKLKKFNGDKLLFIKQYRKIIQLSSMAILPFWLFVRDFKELSLTIVLIFSFIMAFQIFIAFAIASKEMHQLVLTEVDTKFKHLFHDN